MDSYVVIATIITVIAIGYIIAKPYLQKKNILTREQIAFFDYACARGVEYAEQIYKSDPTVDRKKLALEASMDILRKAGIVPESYMSIIETLLESKVLSLKGTK